MKFIELFAGIGGMGYGLMQSGMECVGFVEWDKYAHKAFKLLHDPEERMWARNDITSVTDDDIRLLGRKRGHIQIISGGFPCQAFSIAGKREGFADQTRGTLFFEIIRFASILRPDYLLLENVTGLLSHDNGRTFGTILLALDELGYDCEWNVLNSAAYVPQNRERVFIVGHSRNGSRRKIFPFEKNGTLNDNLVRKTDKEREWVLPTITTKSGDRYGDAFIRSDRGIRKLTEIELFKLQSYPGEWVGRLKENGIEDRQIRKMAGNGVTSAVAYEIGKRLMEVNA